MYIKKLRIIIFTLFLLALSCGSSNKKGTSSDSESLSEKNVGDTPCMQCHSAVTDPLTDESIITQYNNSSPHKDSELVNKGNGCEGCHGSGSQHNGVGPIADKDPFINSGEKCETCHKSQNISNAHTKFADSKHANVEIETSDPCRRCHSHEGAVLGAMSGLTGSNDILENTAYQGAVPLQKQFSKFNCGTCHEHGGGLRTVKARDDSGNIVNWNPSKSNLVNDEFNLCTSCHTLKSYDGSSLLASGNAINFGTTAISTKEVGFHNTSWYRVIASTHYNNSDNVAAGGISGYVIRIPKTSKDAYESTKNPDAKPCLDCHSHEAMTNSNKINPWITTGSKAYSQENETIYTEWAKSGHAGKLLQVKLNAVKDTTGTAAVDIVMMTTVDDSTAPAWFHYDWSASNRQDCQRCHTATGASNYLNDPSSYNNKKNDFQHLAGWTIENRSSKQREMLYCWACHKNIGDTNGGLYNPGAITADYNFKGSKAKFPDAGSSNICIACHAGRESGETITALPLTGFNNVTFKNSHYITAAGLMYVKIGFTAFIDPGTVIGSTTYEKSLTSDTDGGDIKSTHRKLGSSSIIGDHDITVNDTQLLSGGPCVTCHMTGKHHTLEMDASAFNNVCIKCHDKEGSVTLTSDNFKDVFIEEQAVLLKNALEVAKDRLLKLYNISYNPAIYPYFYDDLLGSGKAVKDWTRGGALTNEEAMKLMGACFNINLLTREPSAYAHARTYTRRLIYDTIDYLDDKLINLSTGAAAIAFDPVKYVKGPTAIDSSTTESMKFLNGYSRSTGAWNTSERP
ncbi:cytochrome C [Candidatus Poribacteria bacterium]|nr:cytochrome C [Candidatus Poribacteria bacterium]